MKKKIISLCLVLALAATAIVGASLAYFTDTEADTNVFTLGNIKIDLVEEQRKVGTDGKKTTELEQFQDNQILLPIVGSAQGDKDSLGMPVAENYVDKIVTVDNEGSVDAYVRVLFAFPADMDDAQSAAEMMLHWNHNGKLEETTGNYWTRDDAGVQVTLDGKTYNVYNYTYTKALTKKGTEGATTVFPAICGVYIDSRVNATSDKDGNVTYTMVNSRNEAKTATYAKGTGPKIIVLTQGVQADGFTSANEALKAGFGDVTATNAQTWFNAVTSSNDRADIN